MMGLVIKVMVVVKHMITGSMGGPGGDDQEDDVAQTDAGYEFTSRSFT